MKRKIKIISVIASLIIAIGLSFALNYNEAKANDEICYTWHENINNCDVPATNCSCPIIVTPDE